MLVFLILKHTKQTENTKSHNLTSIPDYTETNKDVITINGNQPDFTDDEKN